MTQEELINVFKYIVKKCDMLINNGDYEADAYTQDTVEDIAELCNHILDGDYGKLVETKESNLENELSYENYKSFFKKYPDLSDDWGFEEAWIFAEYFYKLGLKAQKE